MIKKILPFLAIALIIFGGWWFARQLTPFVSGGLGIRFGYPPSYEVTELAGNEGESRLFGLVLLVPEVVGSTPALEGPTAITIDLFKNAGQLSLRDWILAAPEANFQLSPTGELATTTVAGQLAHRWRWSGLYEGESVAWLKPGSPEVLVASVTWLEPADQIKSDFELILKTIK